MHAAVCAESCYWTCQYARDAAWFKLAGGSVPVAKWRTLYRSPELLDLRYVAPLAVESTDKKAAAKFRREYRAMIRELQDLGSVVREVFRMTPEARDELAAAAKQTEKELEQLFFQVYRADLKDEIEFTREYEAVVATPESMFFVMVAMPCLLEYGEPIGALYARVIDGDFESLCQLLRLDKFAQKVPEVAAQYDAILQRGDLAQRRTLLDAIAAPPQAPLSEADMYLKFSQLLHTVLSGLDVRLAKLRKYLKEHGVPRKHWPYAKLSYRQMQSLIDAIIEDRKGNIGVLPDAPEAFKMAVYRKRGFWQVPPFAA